MKKPPLPTGGSGATLGDLLRQRGVPVTEPRAAGAVPTPTVPASAAVEPLDLGGATKLVLRREKKGRGGKTATVIDGLKLPPSALERMARELKRALGCGATVDGNAIVLQGDLAARVAPWLSARGAKKVVVGN